MRARDLFFAPSGFLRAPWRLAVFIVVAMLLTVLLQGVVVAAIAVAQGLEVEELMQRGVSVTSSLEFLTLLSWLTAVALLLAHVLSVRFVDQRPWSSVWMGARAAEPRRIALGTVLGVLAVGVPAAILIAGGWLDLTDAPGGSSLRAAVFLALFFVPAALVEELMFRGYPFAVLRDAWGWQWALAATSVVFGLLHIPNAYEMTDPTAAVQGVLVVILAGVFLGAVMLATGSFYAAWAAHAAWNWVLAGLLHTEVSGLPFPAPDYRTVDAGPDWATGGAWGPEGGAGAALGMLIGLAWLSSRRGRGNAEGEQ